MLFLILSLAMNKPNDNTAGQTLITKNELAARLKVSPRTIDRWCASRALPHLRAGSRKRFCESDVDAFLRRHVRILSSSPAESI
jgi:excisionase family DNA binding protein